MSGAHAVEIWGKCRDTIEHFDKILGNFRAIAFTVNAAVVSALAKILLDKTDQKFLTHMAVISFGCCVFNMLIWFAEKHYHLYLLKTAKVAEDIEESFDSKERLTHAIKKAKGNQCKMRFFLGTYLHFYDQIYLLPAFLTSLFILLLWPNVWLVMITIGMAVVLWALIRDKLIEMPRSKLKIKTIIFEAIYLAIGALAIAALFFHQAWLYELIVGLRP